MGTASGVRPIDARGNGLLTAGAALAFLGVIATVLDAVLISALTPGLPAAQVQLMQNALYGCVALLVIGIVLLLVGAGRGRE